MESTDLLKFLPPLWDLRREWSRRHKELRLLTRLLKLVEDAHQANGARKKTTEEEVIDND